jgi:hypothetical protein
MFEYLLLMVGLLRATFRSRGDLLAENLLLRQQLAVLTRPTRKARACVPPIALLAGVARMARENPSWGAERVRGELLKLCIVVGKRSVQQYRRRGPARPPSQSWRAFLRNQRASVWAADLLPSGPSRSGGCTSCCSSATIAASWCT